MQTDNKIGIKQMSIQTQQGETIHKKKIEDMPTMS